MCGPCVPASAAALRPASYWRFLGSRIVILEVADIRIKPGQQAEFDRAIQHGIETVISKAAGFRGYKIKRGIESPERYLLMIWWDTLENHMVDFRESDAFGQWRAIVGPYFAHPPVVEHFTLLASSAPRG